jgi:hypothetical protein
MSTTDHKDPANVPTTVTTGPTSTTNPANVSNKVKGTDTPDTAEKKRDEQIADELAHKGAKAEQNYDRENSSLFNK